jgi:hypothetical protein
MFLMGSAFFGMSAYAKHSYDGLLQREDFRKKVCAHRRLDGAAPLHLLTHGHPCVYKVHKDESKATIRVKRQVPDKVSLLYKVCAASCRTCFASLVIMLRFLPSLWGLLAVPFGAN